MKLRLPRPPRPIGNGYIDGKAFAEWAEHLVAELERYSDVVDADTNRYSVTNHTETASLDASTATLATVRDVLGTLIEDLRDKEVLS